MELKDVVRRADGNNHESDAPGIKYGRKLFNLIKKWCILAGRIHHLLTKYIRRCERSILKVNYVFYNETILALIDFGRYAFVLSVRMTPSWCSRHPSLFGSDSDYLLWVSRVYFVFLNFYFTWNKKQLANINIDPKICAFNRLGQVSLVLSSHIFNFKYFNITILIA